MILGPVASHTPSRDRKRGRGIWKATRGKNQVGIVRCFSSLISYTIVAKSMSFIKNPLNELSFQPQKWCITNRTKLSGLKHQFFISCSGIHPAGLGTDGIKMLSANLACQTASSKFPFFLE